jgi:aspartate aminotransferase
MALFSKAVKLIDTENAFKVGPYITAVEATGKKVIRCNFGEPDTPVAPFIKEEVKRQIDLDNTRYCDPQGLASLRAAVARHFSETRGIEATADRVVVFPGAKPSIGLTQQAYCDPGDDIVYPNPGFPIYESFIPYVGCRPVPLHLREEEGFALSGQDIEPLLSDKTKLIILNFPSNPTGAVASAEQLQDVADVIRRKCSPDIRIYSDEVYEDLVFDGDRHHSIVSCPGMDKITIIVGGASKSFSFTGGRVGWALFPTVGEADIFRNLNINYFSCVSPYNQEGARLALESPEGREMRQQMSKVFEMRRDVVVAGLNTIEGITCQTPKGAFYVFPNIGGACRNLGVFDAYHNLPKDVRGLTSPSTLFQMFLLFNYQVATLDRKSFGRRGAEDSHYLRISIATDLELLKEAVRRMADASADKSGFRAFVDRGEYLY